MNTRFGQYIVPTLRKGGIGVLPTDTIYGIVGSALNKKAVLRIYGVRKRNPQKPMIILIGSMSDPSRFGVIRSANVKKILQDAWPGPVSVALAISKPSARKKFTYLHRGTEALAFRLPKPVWLRKLLKKTGPLVAPSANLEGKKPARTIKEAKKYFGDRVDFYIDAGRLVSKPSRLIKIQNGKPVIIRK